MEAAIVDERSVCAYFLSPGGNVLRIEVVTEQIKRIGRRRRIYSSITQSIRGWMKSICKMKEDLYDKSSGN